MPHRMHRLAQRSRQRFCHSRFLLHERKHTTIRKHKSIHDVCSSQRKLTQLRSTRGRLPPASLDAIAPLVRYTDTVHHLHERKHTTIRQHKRIRRSSDLVICRISTDPCRVHNIQIHIIQHAGAHTHTDIDWRSHRPRPHVTNCSQPQHPEPPVSGHVAVVTGNQSPSPVLTDIHKSRPALTESPIPGPNTSK